MKMTKFIENYVLIRIMEAFLRSDINFWNLAWKQNIKIATSIPLQISDGSEIRWQFKNQQEKTYLIGRFQPKKIQKYTFFILSRTQVRAVAGWSWNEYVGVSIRSDWAEIWHEHSY